jgi:hypothetical protein
MSRILTKLRIDEVSAVDAGAGDGAKILLMKRDDTPRSKPHVERHARRLRKLEGVFERIFMSKELDNMETSPATGARYNRSRLPDVIDDDDVGITDAIDRDRELLGENDDDADLDEVIAKALRDHHQGHHSLSAALVQHLHDRLERRRERHGYQKSAKETSMTSHSEFVQSVVKQYGIVAMAKSMVQDQKSYGLDEHQFTQLATEHAQRIYSNDRPDVAFSKLYQGEESVRRACQIAKAMPFVANVEPLVVGGADTRDLSDQSTAIEQLKQLGARKWPTATEAAQFANAFTDPANAAIAQKAHRRPTAPAGGIYPYPRR